MTSNAEANGNGRLNEEETAATSITNSSEDGRKDNPSWDGLKLAKDADPDLVDEAEGKAEACDKAIAKTSSSTSMDAVSIEEIRRGSGDGASADDGDDEDDGDEEEEEDDSSASFQLTPDDASLLEELLKMKLSNLPEAAASLLPPKSGGGVKLFQPRSKLEQFEDILMESQMMKLSGELRLPARAIDDDFGSVGFDFDASDAIFAPESHLDKNRKEATAAEKTKEPDQEEDQEEEGDEVKEDEKESADDKSTSSASNECDCGTCREKMRHKEELMRLRQTWMEVREATSNLYSLMLSDAWNDSNRERPDLSPMKEKIRQLVWRDAHQLYQRLEATVKEFVLEQKLKLVLLLQKEAKNPNLAQDFIRGLLDGYERLCNASMQMAPILIDLENEHLSKFSLTWEVLNKHLYQHLIYFDPIIQNNVPIFISQVNVDFSANVIMIDF